MHPTVFTEIERVVSTRIPSPFRGRVLEVGASHVLDHALLAMPVLASARERVGINLEGAGEYDGYRIVAGNANAMPQFSDASFDLVLCNATLEHDARFWMTVAEMHRVLAPGGAMVVGVPGYADPTSRVGRRVRSAVTRRLGYGGIDWLANSTLTYRIHERPGDYYRFSPQAVAEVFLDHLDDVGVHPVMLPPRIIGSGIKPGS